MKENILKIIKESKAIIIVIIGVLTVLVTVLNTSSDVIESIPSEVTIDSVVVEVDSIPLDSLING